MSAARYSVVGIDVGGTKKGFMQWRSAMGGCCPSSRAKAPPISLPGAVNNRPAAVGIDAPCRWSITGRARLCERELASLGIPAFSTPSAIIGEAHPFYRWMVNGIALYRVLVSRYHLYDGGSCVSNPVCFETFSQGIACALAGNRLSARNKRMDRRRLLEREGIDEPLTNIDEVDAALCAVAAQHVLSGCFTVLGDADEGYILLPRCS